MALIQIFAKPPVEGKVKTRLIADLGEKPAADIYRYCLDHAINLVRQSGIEYQLWLSELSDDPIFQGEDYKLQLGVDLGSRMLQAISSQLKRQAGDAAKVVLIGSDCLDMTIDHLRRAIEALETYDIVLLPTIDGGYALIACRKIEAQLFANVEWGSDNVFVQTRQNARNLDYQVLTLETIRDIDTLCDVNHYAELTRILHEGGNNL